MKKVKKIIALSIGLIMTTSLFTGCSVDGLVLVKAFEKSQTINSMETKTDISVKVSASNMSEQEQQMMKEILPMVNGMKISVLAKAFQNQDKTISKVQEDFDLQLGQIPEPISMSVWVNTDATAEKPVFNEVVKFPELMASQLPKEFKGKDYMVMNLGDMTSVPGMPKIDYKKLMSFSKEFQPKFLDFMDKYAKQFNIATKYISYSGGQSFLQDNKIQTMDTYEVKLTDKSFKELMHYTLNNLAENTDAMNFVKDYMSSMMSIYGITDTGNKSSLNEMNKSFDDLTTQLPQALASLNKTLDSLDNLKILGDNGITIKYSINKDGYVVKENGKADLVVDLPSISKLVGNSAKVASANDPTGIYTISIDFNSDITNINEDVAIVFPDMDGNNSFNYTDMIKVPSTKVPNK